jgi:hypothetical protein
MRQELGAERPFVGREQELSAIGTTLDACRRGGGAVVVLRGEAGIGKTRLLEAAARAAGDMELMWLSGHEADVELPFVALAVPARQKPLTVQAAFVALCSRLTEQKPLLVVVDDAHWLDHSTSDVLLFLARRTASAGIAMIVAARERSDEWSALRPVEFELTGLPLGGTRTLLASVGNFAEPVVTRLHDATGGNPLALLTIPTLMSSAQRVGAEPLGDPLRATDALGPGLRRGTRARGHGPRGRARTERARAGPIGFDDGERTGRPRPGPDDDRPDGPCVGAAGVSRRRRWRPARGGTAIHRCIRRRVLRRGRPSREREGKPAR